MSAAAVAELALDGARAGGAGPGAAAGEAGGAACGDRVRIELLVEGGRILRARHRAFACPRATAAAALACALVEGDDPLASARVGAGALADRLGPSECVDVAADALHAALAAALARTRLAPAPARTVVAMSGGVDSAVALLRALRGGREPVGVTLRLWVDPAAPDGERACCSPTAVRAARALCERLGVPHVTLDLREPFRRAVVDDYLGAHAAGRTPNPCVRCNGAFRFDALAAFADRVGAREIATGHYARICRRGGRALVARGADGGKDQSYMLAGVSPALLERVWFPLGGQTKTDTRAEAAAAGLEAAGRPESQEACFVGGGDHRRFLERHGAAGRPGALVRRDGSEVGRHEGTHRFTAGQRRGIGVASARPLYVLAVDGRSGRVTVGERHELATREVRVSPGRLLAPVGRAEARIRLRGEGGEASVRPAGDGFVLRFREPVAGVAPGQVAVLYRDGAVVGAGTVAG